MDNRPGASIVRLGTNLWPIWNMQFRAVLDSKNLGEVLEEPAEAMTSTTSSQTTAQGAAPSRAAQDKQAKGLMALSVEKIYLTIVDESETTREAWVKLEKLHTGNSKARKAALAREGDRVLVGDVHFSYCRTEDMAADFLTKALSPDKFRRCREMIGMVSLD
ncbi:hypothetical protein DUNSADRAFT_12699 [Dunaliella salina]|uniref:Encoded protein n=1 Tax=Dunaliella salina TaxID=3046 RepID=A0ABQ7GAT7_DUNSA|nr:hypothetical protein DUNSADRAFT_12699 [Dunaliella salina]|eukprot:KAF5831725.1 hypothetical protein DUNSADRAFT_12699 [Dunaliella salina]